MTTQPPIRLIPLAIVEQMTSLGRNAIYQLARDPASGFPQPRKVTARATRWVESEVAEWCASRPTGVLPSPNPRAHQQIAAAS